MKVTMITEYDKRRIYSNVKSQIRFSLKADFDHAVDMILESGERTRALVFYENAHANMYWYVSGIARTLMAMPNVTIDDAHIIEYTLRKEVDRLYKRYNKGLWNVEIPRIDRDNY